MMLGCVRQPLSRAIAGLALFFCLLGWTGTGVLADCLTDSSGEVYCGAGACADRSGTVWCAGSYEGDALRTRYGEAVCGKGKCAVNRKGEIYCSSEPGGAVTIDSKGRVRCFGLCEAASRNMCVHEPAASAEPD